MQLFARAFVACRPNENLRRLKYGCPMSNVTEIHGDKTPIRLHYVVEWAQKRNLTQADIVREVGADKSVVSRWFGGMLPKQEYLEKLAELFGTDIHGLFRHPDDDWLAKFFRDKSEDQREHAIQMLRLLFKDQDRTGTGG
jgi:transcriptional regulator with XRE-family HTH domain